MTNTVTNNSFANSAIILSNFPILTNAKTSLSLIPNALLVVNLRFLCSEESLENAQR
jgi:hydroxyethylthiazole kinase-like sugar kinase family protein